ncbi:MAG TPA: hypothetical protein VNM67_03660 [Thermoanaerobaculia bacterium]|jgi:uncharacterized DUF497 family protein|nr:hypothetical protein [Thermoanaerobaculia bacterium]
MVNWNKFDAADYDLEFNEEKLSAHGVSVEEAAELLWNEMIVRKNKGFKDRVQILGRADSGRSIKLIVHIQGKTLRVITGWPL